MYHSKQTICEEQQLYYPFIATRHLHRQNPLSATIPKGMYGFLHHKGSRCGEQGCTPTLDIFADKTTRQLAHVESLKNGGLRTARYVSISLSIKYSSRFYRRIS